MLDGWSSFSRHARRCLMRFNSRFRGGNRSKASTLQWCKRMALIQILLLNRRIKMNKFYCFLPVFIYLTSMDVMAQVYKWSDQAGKLSMTESPFQAPYSSSNIAIVKEASEADVLVAKQAIGKWRKHSCRVSKSQKAGRSTKKIKDEINWKGKSSQAKFPRFDEWPALAQFISIMSVKLCGSLSGTNTIKLQTSIKSDLLIPINKIPCAVIIYISDTSLPEPWNTSVQNLPINRHTDANKLRHRQMAVGARFFKDAVTGDWSDRFRQVPGGTKSG